jgi:hypothetical protein
LWRGRRARSGGVDVEQELRQVELALCLVAQARALRRERRLDQGSDGVEGPDRIGHAQQARRVLGRQAQQVVEVDVGVLKVAGEAATLAHVASCRVELHHPLVGGGSRRSSLVAIHRRAIAG